ncbi:MAG TPA: tetratricopeptide repeat protein [Acidobacteriaceae bacterium]|nr:tetratricopeptide repeat protein [Acidobacteriaceae bacterium]
MKPNSLGLCFLLPLLAFEGTNSAQNRATRETDPASIFSRGVQAMQTGRFGAAEDDFKTVIAIDPRSAAAYTNLGVSYMRQAKWHAALLELRHAASLAPNDPGIFLNIGLAYYRQNRFSAAIEPFKIATQLAPDSIQARYLLGLCYFFTNDYQHASLMLEPLWQNQITNLNYLYVLSIAAGKSSNGALEQRALTQMINIGQNTPELHLYLGKAWLAKDEKDKALKEFKAAASADEGLPLVHYFLGRVYLEQHAYGLAEAEMLRDIQMEPRVPYNYENLGLLYAQTGQTEKAIRYFREALQHDPTLVNSYVGLAKIYKRTGHYQKALAMLTRAEAIVPSSASVHYLRGQVLMRLGQPTAGHEELAASSKLLRSLDNSLQTGPIAGQPVDAQVVAQP